MDYILERLIAYHCKYEKVTDNTLRVYGNFNGFSVVRYTENQIELDGKITDKEDFENWLQIISV